MQQIFDFHTHPYLDVKDDISPHRNYFEQSAEIFIEELTSIGITRFAGSAILHGVEGEKYIKEANDTVYTLRETYGKNYYPGITVDSRYVNESKKEIDRMLEKGLRLIGELVPYHYGWNYSDDGFEEILSYTDGKNVVYSLHTTDDLTALEKIAEKHRDTTFVFAHPGELNRLLKHIAIMKRLSNVYLDLSGTGLFRYGMLKRLCTEVGADRIIFGTDHPVCNPGMYVGGVGLEPISEKEKELILHKNAERILEI